MQVSLLLLFPHPLLGVEVFAAVAIVYFGPDFEIVVPFFVVANTVPSSSVGC